MAEENKKESKNKVKKTSVKNVDKKANSEKKIPVKDALKNPIKSDKTSEVSSDVKFEKKKTVSDKKKSNDIKSSSEKEDFSNVKSKTNVKNEVKKEKNTSNIVIKGGRKIAKAVLFYFPETKVSQLKNLGISFNHKENSQDLLDLFVVRSSKSSKFIYLSEYFSDSKSRGLMDSILEPIRLTKVFFNGCFKVKLSGGGKSGQAGALVQAISKFIVELKGGLNNENNVSEEKKILKSLGFLTRDSRVVESKKVGKHSARRSSQFSKR